jgi:serine/threonine protein kinase/Flp pilus assembly protein TadD
MIGETILHYRIIEKLGAGGMGVVYLAEDMKLKREVAIKFLPHHISADKEERQRFEIEAQAAASLNHQNITTIYSIEETENQTFIVMEYIKGTELKDKIKSGLVQTSEAINIAIQIAEGLEAAHKKGIVHRDIKSQNIMITADGKVKIMDFGLAKVGKGSQVTKIGTTVGTVAYMSPEQAKGEELDHRTDIWSFGVVLYEMLTGKQPFKGDYDQAIIYSILNEEPELEDKFPSVLKSITLKVLSKDLNDRYQNINEMLVDLYNIKNEITATSYSHSAKRKTISKKKNKKWFVPSIIIFAVFIIAAYFYFDNLSGDKKTTTERKMIVVLPFQNLGSSDDDYFADGITGEITSKLSGLSGLGVIARSSAMQYKNTNKSLKQIGEELGVQYVLEGTVQWEKLPDGKKRIRVNPELISLENSTQIWSKPYEADFSNVFTLQTDIASTVAEALNLNLVKTERVSLKNMITNNSEAYDLYLKATYFSQDIITEKSQRIASEMLEKAIELDSNFAEAYARLSTVQSNMHWSYFIRSEENLLKSKANAEKSLLINPNSPEAHIAMGDYYYHGVLDYESALKKYYYAIKLNPNHIDALNGIAFVLRRQGKMQEAIEYFKKTFELNPRDYQTVFSIGETYGLVRDYKTGISFLDKAIIVAPEIVHPYLSKAYYLILDDGNTKKSKEIITKVRESKIGLDTHQFTFILYLCNKLNGDFEEALNQIKGIKEIDDQFYYKPEDLFLAEIYMLLKNKPLAEKHFQAAVKIIKEKIKDNPQDSRLHTSLGIAYAGLGEKENAIREGKYGYELLPVSKEAWRGTWRLLDLATIYTMVGEHELALDAIEDLLKRPTDAISVSLLKLDPVWEPLHSNKRYQKLIKI